MKRVARWALTLAIVALLVVFARTVDWHAAWAAVRRASPSLLLLAAALNLASLALKGARWWIFLRPTGAGGLGLAMRATVAGAGLNNVLVGNGGDAARVVFVARVTATPSATVLATLALERMFDVIGYVLLLALSAITLPLPRELEQWRLPAELALVPIVALLVFLVRRRGEPETESVAEAALPLPLAQRARRYGRRFLGSLAVLSTGPRFVGALLLSLGAWALQVGTYAVAAQAAHEPLPLAGNVAALLGVNLGLLVRATPGNVGFFQFVYALTTTPFGIPRDTAIAVAFLIQTLQVIPVTLLGVLLAPEFVFRRKRSGRAIPEAENA